MNDIFCKEYWTAACKEIEIPEEMYAWEVVGQTEDVNGIDSIWA